MKTKILVLGAVVTAFAFTSFAAEPLLSPRAKDNQIKVITRSVDTQGGTVTFVTSTTLSTTPVQLSPRAKENQTKVITSSVDTQGGTVSYVTSTSPVFLSPRAKESQTKPVTVAPMK